MQAATQPSHRLPAQRVFLNWDQPALPRVADYLIERFGRDHGDAWVVVPTARAGRRLETLLLERLPAFVPPHIVTPGSFVDAWVASTRSAEAPRVARPLEATMAWVTVLRDFAGADDGAAANREAGQSRLASLIPAPPDPQDWPGWGSIAQRVALTREQLATGLATFADAASVAAGSQERWSVLAALDQAYEATLTQWHRIDRETARREALSSPRNPTWSQPVILAAFVDQTPLQAKVLERCADVTSLIFADATQADRFDSRGGLIEAAWGAEPLEIPADALQVVSRRSEEPEAVAHAIADEADDWQRVHGELIEEKKITVALADEQRGPSIVRGIRSAGGSARTAAGRPLTDAAPATLLQSFARLLRTGRLDALAEVARHPHIELFVAEVIGSTFAGMSWPTLIDEWATLTLRSELLSEWLVEPTPTSTRGSSPQAEAVPHPTRGEAIAQLYRCVLGLLPVGDVRVRPFSAWSEPIREALRRVYRDHPLSAEAPQDAGTVQCLEAIACCLNEQAELSALATGDPSVDASSAIQWTLARLAGKRISDPPTAGDIEAMGLLDAALDDAPILVVASANDGYLPGSITETTDGLLTDSLRTQLGVPNNAQRFARDAYLLEAMRRPRVGFKMIAARRGDDDEPLKPSRLWVRGSQPTHTASRLLRFYDQALPGELPPAEEPIHGSWLQPGRINRFVIPRPASNATLPKKLSVTAFRTYLSCPYRFYLKHILCLRTSHDNATELDPPTFGSLLHDAIADFGKTAINAEDFEDQLAIRDQLISHLQRRAVRAFGREPRSSVRVQLAFAEERLEALASLQANWFREGWTIAHVEHTTNAEFQVPGGSFRIEGRIDRIDIHPELGLRVIDFKTGDTPAKPLTQHVRDRAGQRRWLDLQLPLYRDLIMRDQIFAGMETTPIHLGYAVLPRKTDETAWSPLQADTTFWSEAATQRDAVLTRILRRDFRPAHDPPTYADAFSQLCADDWSGREEDLQSWSDDQPIVGADHA
ncbi:MAG: PD-(D/E)XK nuclease family protein [Planctomycetota bacterium]